MQIITRLTNRNYDNFLSSIFVFVYCFNSELVTAQVFKQNILESLSEINIDAGIFISVFI